MDKVKKTLVILTPGFARDEKDTTCLPFLQDYIKALNRIYPDINVKVLAFQYPYEKGNYKWKGVDIYSAGGKSKKDLSRLLTWRRVWKELRQIYKKEGIDIIHSLWLTECCLIGQKFSKRFKIKHVAFGIGQDVLKANKYLKLLDFDSLYLTVMSKSLDDKLESSIGKRARQIISGGLDIQKISTAVTDKSIDIIGVGALSPLKNYELFVDILDTLKKDFPGIKSLIIGAGEQEQMLEAKIKELQLGKNIELVGEVPHDSVFSYLGKSKVFLHTSAYEGQSTVMMEALAMGLTVVCFDVGRLHVDGKVIVCKDKEEMIGQIKKLMNSSLDFKPALVRTMDDMVEDFVKIYEL